MSDRTPAAETVARILRLETELAHTRSEIERARAVARAADAHQHQRWRHVQEENVRLRSERDRLRAEVAELRKLPRLPEDSINLFIKLHED
jgi:multidrug resistance efflux pump